MCYSNSNTSQLQALKDRFKKTLNQEELYESSYFSSGFNFPKWPIVTPIQMEFMQWGLIPNWYKKSDPQGFASHTLNAKIETVHEKPSFRKLVNSHRCLIPSTGFFEYQHAGKDKIPYFIRCVNQSIFSFGGLYDTWIDGQSGEIKKTFTMITMPANSLMQKIHNHKMRMPMILPINQENHFLDGEPLESFQAIQSKELKAHTVNKKNLSENNPMAQLFFDSMIMEQGSLF